MYVTYNQKVMGRLFFQAGQWIHYEKVMHGIKFDN
jgi:hypothetical protein